MDASSEERMFGLLDTIAGGVVDLRQEVHAEIGGLRKEMHTEIGKLRNEMNVGFARVDRRIGHLETRVESLEDEFRGFRAAMAP